MIQNFIKIALRNLSKNAGYTAINVLGLSIGLSACLLIGLWVVDEMTYDQFHEKANRIYRTHGDVRFSGADLSMSCAPAPMAATLKKDYPQLEEVCRIWDRGSLRVQKNEEVFTESKVMAVDASAFQVFTFPLMEGNPQTALAEPNTVVISERVARKYFADKSPVGESLKFNEDLQVKITGVMRNIPKNSHIQADFLISMLSYEDPKNNEWLSFNYATYLLFREDARPEAFAAEWPKIVNRYIGAAAEKLLGQPWEEMEKNGTKVVLGMMPITDIHLHGGNRNGDISPNGSIAVVRVFGAVALFILLLAAVNFMNLSTARSTQRAREVGVRKVMGSGKNQLVGQFLTESVLLSTLAGLLALPTVWLTLPAFNLFSGKEIVFNPIQNPTLLLGALGFILLTGLLAGIYPAFVLSGFQPIKVLKFNPLSGGGQNRSWLRNGLVTFQFVTSLVLIIGALVTWQQMDFIQHKDLGFDRSQVLVVTEAETLGSKAATFKSEVLSLPMIESGTISGFLPTNDHHSDQVLFKGIPFVPENGLSLNTWWVDGDYLNTMRIKLLEGRNFDSKAPADSNAVVINRSAVRAFGFKEPIGQKIYRLSNVETQAYEILEVVGVVDDFHFESLRDEIEPLIFFRGDYPASISFRLKTDDLSASIAGIKKIWEKTTPGLPFQYEFMDEQFDRQYRSEHRAGTLLLSFAILAIFIACLGLFGLATFTAQRRTKEIGIRKVLGASVTGITGLLAKDFLKLVLLAILIATPLAYYFMQQWLADFAYRIALHWWMFAAAGLTALAIAFLTVSFQSIKAALMNPVKSLRSE
ncbi:MAG: ABC transporter permease [Saprospiraceae bacterium]|nr:ABC transporter permease [Saprospiraceae bacterium]